MTIAPHSDPHNDPHLSDRQRETHALARDDAALVLEIAEIAEEQIGETEDERTLRLRFEEALRSLRWDLGAPWSDHVISADRVLRTPKGDLDEQRVCEFLSRVLDGQSAAEARHGMDRRVKSRKLAEARQGVAARLHGLADAQWGQAHAPSPVHRDALPPAVPASPAPVPEQLPKRVAQPTPAEPMYPKAPPERPAEQTGVIAQKAVESLRRAGHDTPASDAALASLNGASGVAFFGPAADSSFGATSLPQVRAGDTQRMAPVSAHAPEVLADLANDDEPIEVAPRGKGLALGGVRTGASAAASAERLHLELTDTAE